MLPVGIDWSSVRRVLVVRLRSIGDTVLSTPSLIALRRFLPDAEVDILLEEWVAPILDDFDSVDEVLRVGGDTFSKWATVRTIRSRNYDVVFNLHGGTTATFLTFASGSPHRVGYKSYRYSFLHNHLLSSAAEFWKQEPTHSAEQQLALLGYAGVPVDDRPRTRLAVSRRAVTSLEAKLAPNALRDFALMHPTAAFDTKQWATEHFARTAEFLQERGLQVIAVAAANERRALEDLRSAANVPVEIFDDLSLPEITALASKASLFVGNDSGIAHIAAAVGTPSVVIFGSSNRDHWRPWTDSPNEMVFDTLPCQPCPGHECKEFGEPRCILGIKPERVFKAIERVLQKQDVTS